MSDQIKHECAVTLLRLRRGVEYFQRKYGTAYYGFQKLALMLEKQHNRGQDGAGIACVGLDPEPGVPCYRLEKSNRPPCLADLLEKIGSAIPPLPDEPLSGDAMKHLYPFCGELYLGHLRYGTFGRSGLEACHPFVRENACLDRTLLLAGNFNLTDTAEIFRILQATGHHPASRQDGALILQLIGHYLEQMRDRRRHNFSLAEVLADAMRNFDGAYTLCGLLGNGEAFAVRDPAGIRPGYYYFDDEVVAVSSERPAIQAAFDCSTAEVGELPPGQALLISRDAEVRFEQCLPRKPLRRCVFERIYFSRGNDAGIHQERKALGRALVPQLLEAVNRDWENTLFSYIPNTAQISFHGMLEALQEECWRETPAGRMPKVRFGQIAVKDAKFRTFIADAAARRDFYMHIYDVTYGLLHPGSDSLVVIDDSIVRGNTMRNAILPILDRLAPRRIVIASAAPPIRYPDCYGIDMASLRELVAFEAAVDLLNMHGKSELLERCYEEAKRQLSGPEPEMTNCVKPVYDEFTDAELTDAIARRLKPEGLRAELTLVFQTCANLAKCCPDHRGDWYFTGDYPTPGGFRVVNRALVNYMEKRDERAY
ncbi:class II glutamine amidotransferase [Victivallis vadensis]|uniref:Amidophosphoribosyltransferase n=1 Tax=Victivallis vadensis TaxID=172901 RepID=A0A2U1B8L9_9BACT|nr:class II glutamine amidotransferase [Victivallis vadensis]NMD87951.1 amidophosphoribosyltransferase [Victivallis vadensis]PVY44998.1 amidophosphoribosyltransferase [Victivallis vadensis]